MDALTHAIEAYVSTAATPVTDACAIKAIEIIVNNLKDVVDDGQNRKARDAMQYGEYLAGMAFFKRVSWLCPFNGSPVRWRL